VGLCLAVTFAAFGIYRFAETILPAHGPFWPEAGRPIAPMSLQQSATENERASPTAVIALPKGRRDNEIATPVRATLQAKPILLQREPALESWFIASYLRCWTPPTALPQSERYAAKVRVVHNADGSFSTPPRLVNPPSNPEWRAFADSAMRAVAKCSPLQVPARYASHFDQWKKMTLYFSPDSSL